MFDKFFEIASPIVIVVSLFCTIFIALDLALGTINEILVDRRLRKIKKHHSIPYYMKNVPEVRTVVKATRHENHGEVLHELDPYRFNEDKVEYTLREHQNAAVFDPKGDDRYWRVARREDNKWRWVMSTLIENNARQRAVEIEREYR